MTQETTKLIGLALGGLGVGVGAVLLWLLFNRGADEEGIRVKSGSLILDTVSGHGFKEDNTGGNKKFKTKKDPKGSVHVSVNRGTCSTEFFAAKVSKVTVTIEGVRDPVVLVDQGEFGASEKFKKSTNDFTLEYPDDPTITAIEAFDQAGDRKLACTFTAPVPKATLAYIHICSK